MTTQPHTGAGMYLVTDDRLHVVAQPNTLITGDPGCGKSALAKCLVKRSRAIAGHAGHWTGIVDPRGEYGVLAEVLGLDSARLHPGGTERLNPLDAGPGASMLGAEEVTARRAAVLRALVGSVLGRDLDVLEDAAVRAAVGVLPITATGPQPVLGDVAALVAAPTAAMAERCGRSECEMVYGLHEVRSALAGILDRDLRGMCDGPSTVRCDWSAGGLVLDLSALHAKGSALRLAALASTAWLEAAVACPEAPDTPRRCQIVEESWILLGNEHTAAFLERCLMQSDLYGVTTIVTTHRLSDLAVPPDDGRAFRDGVAPAGQGVSRPQTQAGRAQAFVAHTPARVVMRQTDLAEVELTRSVLGLTDTEASLVPSLGRGYGLWAVDGSREFVRHVIAPDEWRICESGPAALVV